MTGYRFGWERAYRPEFRGMGFSEAEPVLRRDWESRHPERPWNEVVDSVREAWHKVTGRKAA